MVVRSLPLVLAVIAIPASVHANLVFQGSYDGTVGGGAFGHSCVVIGDMDGDGAAEFAIGAPLDDTGGEDAGRVFIYRGGNPLPALPTWVITGEPGDRLGTSLARANVDDDFVPDLVMGAPGSASTTGRVVIAYGSNPVGSRPLRSVNGDAVGSAFGTTVAGIAPAFGNLRFIVGAPANNADAGAVHGYANGDPPSSSPLFVIHGTDLGEQFGAALSEAGITRGFIAGAEFLVGAPGLEDSNWPGRYALFFFDAPDDTLPDGNFEGEAIGLELGRSISGGVDITPNFFEPTDDWVVGAPGDVNGGSARGPYKYFGTDPSRRFGSTVRLMQDVTRSSIPDMAIADGVVVHVYPGALTPGTDPVATLVPDGGGEGFGRAISNSGRMNPSFPRNLFMVGAPDAHGSTGKVYIYGDPTTPTDVPAPGAPNAIEFGAPTPNPSPGTFAWSLRLPQPLRARLAVLDLAGREVAKLHDGPLAAGRTDFEWRPAASSPPGIYWGVLEIDGQRWSRRMVRLK